LYISLENKGDFVPRENRTENAFVGLGVGLWRKPHGLASQDKESKLLDGALSRLSKVQREARKVVSGVEDVLDSPDGRWAIVSTAITASVAVTIAWLALAAAPPGEAATYEPRRTEAALPYDILARLPGAREIPGISSDDGLLGQSGSGFASRIQAEAGSLLNSGSGTQPSDALKGLPGVSTRMLAIENGGTLMGMLQEAGVSQQDAVTVVDAMREVYSPRSVRAGQVFEASFGLEETLFPRRMVQAPLADTPTLRLLSLSFAPSIEREVRIELSSPDAYLAHDIAKELVARYQHAGATIDSSLYLAAMQAGIPAAVVVEMIHMFSYDVDFQRDVQPGDQFETFFTHFYTPEGDSGKPGEILTASMTLSGKTHTLYRFGTPDGDEFFDADGNSARSLLMRTPVDGARISSRFGARRHPILGYTRMHQGIDFAVSTGTPIMAAGNGTVDVAGRAGGYGNLLVIRHANGFATAYAHLSKYANGVRKGARVRQGQIVAYSGATGLATGPHLHYEVRENGSQVNPATIEVASGRKLEDQELEHFLAERGHIEQLVASMPMQTRVAEASGLRQTSEQ
jgi:murein DD-endopeptidase MepM/ murein hydrolase activator NlpD